MPFYASFRDLQQELTRSFQSTGHRIQFQEAIAALRRQGKITQTPADYSGYMPIIRVISST